MLKKTITYTDYNGTERTEDFYFNLSKAELVMMEASVAGGLKQRLEKIVQNQDNVEIMKVFQDLIRKAYGEKSADGKRFIKSEEISEAFEQTEAYSELVMEIMADPEKAAAFINGIIPTGLVEKLPANVGAN